MGKDVFISYKSDELEEAAWLKNVLESNGISCWMAPDSIPGGSSYASEIGEAITECKVFVLVLSDSSQNSIWVSKELDCALNASKPVLPFAIENFELNKEFNYYLTNVQRYDAYADKAKALEHMLTRIRAIIGVQGDIADDYVLPVMPPEKKENKAKKIISHTVAVIVILFLLLLVPVLGVIAAAAYVGVLIYKRKKGKNNKK